MSVARGTGTIVVAMVLLLAPWLPGDVVLGTALAYRIAYYLSPMGLAVALFAGWEALERREVVRTAGGLLAQWAPELVPRFFAM